MRFVLLTLALAAFAAALSAGAGGAPASGSIVACDQQVGTAEEPLRSASVVLDRIGLPRGRYPWPLARGANARWPVWGKWGALVRSGGAEPVTVSVAKPWRRHARIGWGNGTGTDVTFLPCGSTSPWIAYAGGFELKKRGCVPFDVRSGDRIERIRIGFGRACPGR